MTERQLSHNDRDRPWIMRTYSGHSTAAASNELYRTNLAKGQTGLSVAFDLPTQTGYDPDSPLARGEVGKVGVPISHLGDMRTLLDGIPPARMNTSMTINATAPWLLALYVANAEEHGVAPAELRGTTQNDIVKEYLSRGTYILPPEPSRRLTVDMVAWCSANAPMWNPINVCSYHLQEAGATPIQELAFSLATAVGVLDAVRDSGQVPADRFTRVFASISFFVNAGIRFVEEMCKLRAFGVLWERLGRERYGVNDAKALRFRYGVQVNSLGLTEAQPENNVQRIVLEMLAVTLSKSARARSIQLPAWNEALGLPRPWDQQWSLRMQQVLAYESDLLDYDDLFDGSKVVEARTAELCDGAWAELDDVLALGGAFAAVETLKARLVSSMAERTRLIEAGEQVVVGVNQFTETEPSPLGGDEAILRVDPRVEAQAVAGVARWRAERNAPDVDAALAELRRVAESGENVMPASIALARAGGTTGEWGQVMRDVFGEYRGPTGVAAASAGQRAGLREVAAWVRSLRGGPPRLLVAKPGLDGHSNGAEQIAVAARDAGIEVIYSGIRQTVDQIAAAARDEDVDVVGLSILSGSHLDLVPDLVDRLIAFGVKAPVVVGGIIPEDDRRRLLDAGVARIYTPTDFDLTRVVREIAELAELHRNKQVVDWSAWPLLAVALYAVSGCNGDSEATTAPATNVPSPPTATAEVVPTGFDTGQVTVTDAAGENRIVPVLVADTLEERARGLMGVTDLGGTEGMLFEFEDEAIRRFYMWQTPMPLDIAFIAADGSVVGTAVMEPCLAPAADACERYAPEEPFLMALEVPAGELDDLGVAPGARISRS